MTQAIKASLLVTAVAVLVGCTSASGPTYTARSLSLANGEQAYQVDCYGLLEGPGICHRKAQEICGQQPVRVLQDMGPLQTGDVKKPNTRELTFQCGATPVAAAVTPPPPASTPVPVPALKREVTLSGDANFDFNHSSLTPTGRDRLDKLVAEARGMTFNMVTVSGYTDGVGSDAYNLGLSERRASTVASYLNDQGLQARRFVAHGYGKANPVASNVTAGGRAQNRRVEISLDPNS